MKIEKRRKQGEALPGWWYGLAYLDFETLEAVWYPIPVNYLIRLLRTIKVVWNVIRSKPTSTDHYIMVHASRMAREMTMKYRMEREQQLHEVERLNREKLAKTIKELQDGANQPNSNHSGNNRRTKK